MTHHEVPPDGTRWVPGFVGYYAVTPDLRVFSCRRWRPYWLKPGRRGMVRLYVPNSPTRAQKCFKPKRLAMMAWRPVDGMEHRRVYGEGAHVNELRWSRLHEYDGPGARTHAQQLVQAILDRERLAVELSEAKDREATLRESLLNLRGTDSGDWDDGLMRWRVGEHNYPDHKTAGCAVALLEAGVTEPMIALILGGHKNP